MIPTGLSTHWDDYLDIISLYEVKINGMDPMGLSSPWADSLQMIALQQVKNYKR